MNVRDWMYQAALALAGLALFCLLTESPVLDNTRRWLGIMPSPEGDQALAMAPLIDCLNSSDTKWRWAYRQFQEMPSKARKPDQARFASFTPSQERWNGQQRERITHCLPDTNSRQAMDGALPTLKPAVERYVNSLLAVSEVTAQFDFYGSPFSGSVSPEDRERLSPRLTPLAEEFLKASNQLQRQVEAQDMQVRLVQRKQIEERFGQDKHWQLSNLMINARQTVDQLTRTSIEGSLTPGSLAVAVEKMKFASNYAEQHMRTPTRDDSGDSDSDIELIWRYIGPLKDTYIKAMERLQRDWATHEDPSRLNDDLLAISDSYDKLVSRYNQEVHNRY